MTVLWSCNNCDSCTAAITGNGLLCQEWQEWQLEQRGYGDYHGEQQQQQQTTDKEARMRTCFKHTIFVCYHARAPFYRSLCTKSTATVVRARVQGHEDPRDWHQWDLLAFGPMEVGEVTRIPPRLQTTISMTTLWSCNSRDGCTEIGLSCQEWQLERSSSSSKRQIRWR